MKEKITSYKDLRVFQNGFEAAMKIFQLTQSFPPEEKFSLTDQVRRSSRSVCGNLAKAWRKRREKDAFVATLGEAEAQACETQVWIEFVKNCSYLEIEACEELDQAYDQILGQLYKMIKDPDKWLFKGTPNQGSPGDKAAWAKL